MISIVIPSYNRRDCVLALLASIHAQTMSDFEVIVVDDCSPDDSVAAIRREYPDVILLVNETNGGPAVSRNRGIVAAKGDIIVGFDSDVTISDRDLLISVADKFSRNPGISGLAFRLLKPDGRTEDRERWWHPLPIEQFADKAFFTSYFSGTGYAFRKDALVKAGLYPEVYYMHYEEVELALRLLDDGGSILYAPDLPVLHHANATSRRSEIHVYYKPRNQILLAASCYPLLKGMAFLLPRLCYQFLLAVKERHLKDFARAFKDGFSMAIAIRNTSKTIKITTFNQVAKLRRGSRIIETT